MSRIVSGVHSVAELLKIRPRSVTEIWFKNGELSSELDSLMAKAQSLQLKIKRVHPQTLDREVGSHQGVVAKTTESPNWPPKKKFEESPKCLLLALDMVVDPQNVGSIMRSAWSFGASGIIITKDRSSGLTPGAIRVASGAAEHVPLMTATNLGAELKTLKDWGFWVYGLAMKEESPGDSQSIFEVELAPKSILVIGSEEKGLRKATFGVCDATLNIPHFGGSSSLNAAVAGAVSSYEYARQNGISKISPG